MSSQDTTSPSIATPLGGIIFAFLASTFLAAVWLTFWLQTSDPMPFSLNADFLRVVPYFWGFAITFCVAPFAFLRWMINEIGGHRIWHYALMGGLIGTGVWLVLFDGDLTAPVGLKKMLLSLTVPGCAIGVVHFAIEDWFRKRAAK
ncbi:hypothetical protein [Shimia sp. Alg240-R146]|uniref:hypothetical protein n=1 Tax=Shimia sp. Alg240-R146 TaxID=2993449 RepID=UPI0022E2A2A6|nr:hypothetical protein [Shimia sp. Alg240-R146]